MEKKREKGLYGLLSHTGQPTPFLIFLAAPTLRLLLRPPLALGTKAMEAALRLGPSATEGQARWRRQRLPLPPLASRLAPSPPSSAHRPATLRTHHPLPSRLCCTVGARPAAQGGRALAPPVSGKKKIRWSSRALRSFAMAELEARKMRYPTTGTEGLLMGILVEGTSGAAKLLRANGITLLNVREEAANVLGKSEMFYFSPMHPPLTEAAQRALDWAVNEKLKSGEDGEVTANHLLLGIWSDKESAGHKILESLGFDDERASLLAKTADQEAAMSPDSKEST